MTFVNQPNFSTVSANFIQVKNCVDEAQQSSVSCYPGSEFNSVFSSYLVLRTGSSQCIPIQFHLPCGRGKNIRS